MKRKRINVTTLRHMKNSLNSNSFSFSLILVYPSRVLSTILCFCLTVGFIIFLSVFFFYRSVCASVCTSVCVSVLPWVSSSFYLSICLFFPVCFLLSICFEVHLSVCYATSVFLFIKLFLVCLHLWISPSISLLLFFLLFLLLCLPLSIHLLSLV